VRNDQRYIIKILLSCLNPTNSIRSQYLININNMIVILLVLDTVITCYYYFIITYSLSLSLKMIGHWVSF